MYIIIIGSQKMIDQFEEKVAIDPVSTETDPHLKDLDLLYKRAKLVSEGKTIFWGGFPMDILRMNAADRELFLVHYLSIYGPELHVILEESIDNAVIYGYLHDKCHVDMVLPEASDKNAPEQLELL